MIYKYRSLDNWSAVHCEFWHIEFLLLYLWCDFLGTSAVLQCLSERDRDPDMRPENWALLRRNRNREGVVLCVVSPPASSCWGQAEEHTHSQEVSPDGSQRVSFQRHTLQLGHVAKSARQADSFRKTRREVGWRVRQKENKAQMLSTNTTPN